MSWGLADALEKPIFLFKQVGITLPADIGGVHFYEYDLANLALGQKTLTTALNKWASERDHSSLV